MECNVKDVRINYEICGEGVPILMIHGWGPDHRMMVGCMEAVFKTMDFAWERIYIDLPGMGKTEAKPWITGPDQMLDVVLGFIDAVIPGRNFVIAGESYGGYIARAIISKRRASVDGLLLICPVTSNEKKGRFQVFEKDNMLLNSLTKDEKESFESEGINVTLTRRVWERYKKEVIPGMKIADYPFLDNCLGHNHTFSFDVDNPAEKFMKPTLMLAGRQDSIVGYEGLWELIESYPRASFVLLDKAGHALQIEQETLFTAAVKEWLDRVAAEKN